MAIFISIIQEVRITDVIEEQMIDEMLIEFLIHKIMQLVDTLHLVIDQMELLHQMKLIVIK